MKLSQVGIRYGGRVILREISLEIFPASITLLIGANGAGKTTLLRIMAGLAKPSVGKVAFTFEEQEKKVPIACLGHATLIYPKLTALENLTFWCKLFQCDSNRERLLSTLARVGLTRYAEEYAGGFSRGMAQRLALARVLLLDPALLLLDEPGTGLDQEAKAMLHSEIVKAKERGAGVVWITHDLAADAECADRLLAITKHRLSYDGDPAKYPVAEYRDRDVA